jgi:hypothetical protein
MFLQGVKDSFACIQTNAITVYTRSRTVRKRLTKSFLFNSALAALGVYAPVYILPITLIFHIVCLIVTAIWTNDVSKKTILMYPIKLYNVSPYNYYGHKLTQIPFEIIANTLYKILLLTCIQLTASVVDLMFFIPYALRTIVSVLLLSLTYGYISWDATLATAGYDLRARFAVIESNTLYFIGFGMPITLASSFWSSFFTSAAVYNLFSMWITVSAIIESQRIPQFTNRVYIPILRPYRAVLVRVVPTLSNKIGNCLRRWYVRKHDSNSVAHKLS